MISGYLSLYLAFVVVVSLIVGFLVLRLKLPSPRLIVTLLIIFIVSPLIIGYLYLVYFDSLPEVTVPDVTGVAFDVAKERLESENLKAREAGNIFEAKYPEGFVVSQRPEPGRNVKVGRIINLMVNSASSKVPVPDLLGKPFSQAGAILQAADLRQGDVRWEKNPGLAEGTVIAQEPLPGEEAVTGSKVDLLVSSTKEMITQEASGEGE
jgi:beta-lactam-binding protein with PASTA domain